MTVNVPTNVTKQVMLARKAKLVNAIDLFRPTETQEPFFRQFAKDGGLEYLVGGGNRSGKTVCVAVAMASIILNVPITMRDGTKLHMRPERWRNEPIKVWLIGINWAHIGKTLFRVFFRKDLFRIIRDQKTGKWRAFDPTNQADKGLYHLTSPSPPLIRMGVDVMKNEMSWENRKERQFSSCELVNGSRVECFASTGERPQGDPCHVIWCDERLDDESWYSELLVRLIDYRGKMVWTSWPSTEPSAALTELSERAAKQLGTPDAKAFEYRFKGADNPYTDSEHRDAIFETMDEDTRRARDEGEMNQDRWRVYARFSPFVHRVYTNDASSDDPLAALIRAKNGIPDTFTRYLILDPGTINPAVLFVAVPPPMLGEFIIPYDELYLHNTHAKGIAEAVLNKTKGQVFEDFIIDAHAARQTPMGFDGTIGSNYEKEFAKCKLRCKRHGSRFSYGSDNVTGRILRLQGLMNITASGWPTLRIMGCPNLCMQLHQCKWARTPKGNPTDKPAAHQKNDLTNCLEYFASRDDCGYVVPQKPKVVDPHSREVVMAQFRKALGISDKPKDGSIYCGAGLAPTA